MALVDARSFLHGVSEQVHRRFRGMNGQVGSRGKVHALVPVDFFGETILVPACRVGLSGWSVDRLQETSAEVNCRRSACLHHRTARLAEPVARRDDVQHALFAITA